VSRGEFGYDGPIVSSSEGGCLAGTTSPNSHFNLSARPIMAKLSRSRSRIGSLLADTTTAAFAVDSKRRVIFFNRGCQELTGWKEDEVLGQTCEYHTESDYELLAAVTSLLAPPVEVLRGKPVVTPVYFLRKTGESLPRLIHFFPLFEDQAKKSVEAAIGLIGPLEKVAGAPPITPAHQLHAELSALRISLRQRYGLKTLVTRSPAMLRVAEQIALAKNSSVPVCIVGENGTGKEHLARILHNEGELRGRTFVPLDCAAISPRELKQTLGRLIELERDTPAQGTGTTVSPLLPGTLCIRHLERMTRDVQQAVANLLGRSEARTRASIRIVTLANAAPETLLESEVLMPELYFLLTSLTVTMVPLRQRREDIRPLAQSILEEFNRGSDRQVDGFSAEVWEQFHEYNWPGNVAELREVISLARKECFEPLILEGHLPFRFRTGRDAQGIAPPADHTIRPLDELLLQVEREQIEKALERTGGNKSGAAKLLGWSRPRLLRRLETLGMAGASGSDATLSEPET